MTEQKPDRPQSKQRRTGMTKGGLPFGRGLMGWVLFVALAIMLIILLNKNRGNYVQITLD